jgi:phosphoribosylformylglycinamidine cyclo-ligase
MHRVFNCGIGLVLVVDRSSAQDAIDRLAALGEPAYVIGAVEHCKAGAPGTIVI